MRTTEFPDGWNKVSLQEITELITSGATPTVGKTELYSDEDKGVPFFRIQNVDVNRLVLSDLKYVAEEVHNNDLRRSQLRPGDVLVTITGRLGTAAVVPPNIKRGNINQHICLVRVNQKIADPNYLAFHLNSKETQREIMQKQHGATRIALNHKAVGSLTINLPDIEMQRKIASILHTVQTLSEFREHANHLTSKVIASVFVDLFGDPTKNPKRWPEVTVSQIAERRKGSIRMGPFGSQLKKSELVEKGVRVLWIENIVDNEFDFRVGKFVTEEKHSRLSAFSIKPYDVLITMMGTIGRVAVVPPNVGRAMISSHLLKIEVDKSVCDSTFLKHMLLSGYVQRQFAMASHGAIMGGLNTGIVKDTKIFLPPLSLQKKFASSVEQIEAIRKNQRAATEEISEIFQSFMDRAFRGQLVN